MKTDRIRPTQVTSGSVMISYYSDRDDFRITLRERVMPDGEILGSRGINIAPSSISRSENSIEFAEMLELMAQKIRFMVMAISVNDGGKPDKSTESIFDNNINYRGDL